MNIIYEKEYLYSIIILIDNTAHGEMNDDEHLWWLQIAYLNMSDF